MKTSKKHLSLFAKISSLLLIAVFSSSAHAIKLSEMFIDNTTGEASAFMLALIFLVALAGVYFFIMAGFEWKKQKQSGPQAEWGKFVGQLVLGVFLGIAVPVYLATIDSVSGQEVELNTSFDGGGI